ncbi:MAG: BTAD domain-containing putative transcriptional regulator [Tissierellia bacterium]|nr:BTAD domain-containing putative transcriptional regulator [Tissierellia bacterium]
MLTLKLLGSMSVDLNGKDLTGEFNAKSLALLSILLLSEGRSASREKLIRYLWPDSSDEAGRYNLRYHLWLIKNLMAKEGEEEAIILANRQSCAINPRCDYRCDILSMERAMDHGRISQRELEELSALSKGELLEGMYFKECDEFNNLILFERQRLGTLRIELLLRLLDCYGRGEGDRGAGEIIGELKQSEPYDEKVALGIMNYYHRVHQPGNAVLYYRQFKDRIITFLGIQPTGMLKERYREIQAQVATGAAAPPKRPRPDQGKSCIYLETSCIGEIEYYWLSEFVEELMKVPDGELQELLRPYRRELGFLSLTLAPDPQPLQVRVARSFLKMMRELAQSYQIKLRLLRGEKIDRISKVLLDACVAEGLLEIVE